MHEIGAGWPWAVTDESIKLLREIRDIQKAQIELLRAHLLPPWLRFRSSLRNLLIATTFVAVALGLIVAFAR